MRLSRHCYDKPHRCPGWAGGGWRYARVDHCDIGSLPVGMYDERLWKWRFHRCDHCDTVAIPHVLRWLDVTWWRWVVEYQVMRFRWWREDRRDGMRS